MRIAHISDLHLGKQLYGFSLIEDQAFILDKIVSILDEKKVETLLIAGDIYDKNIPSIDGIKLFRKFLNDLVKKQIKVLVISGNHDSDERLTFGSEFMSVHNLYFSKIYDGKIEPVQLKDEFGNINFYLLPFLKQSEVKHFFPDEKISDYNDVLNVAIKNLKINKNERNVILSHQAIINAKRCDSEESIIGMVETVSASIYEDFDYVALGHIHTPQKITDRIIYCGSPLKYSVSEIQKDKTLPIIELGEKKQNDAKNKASTTSELGTRNEVSTTNEAENKSKESSTFDEKCELKIEYVPLTPQRDVREIKGKYDEILTASKNDPYNKNDYINVILTNENQILDAMSCLREIYPNILQLSYENSQTKNDFYTEDIDLKLKSSPIEIFAEFFENRSGKALTEEQQNFMQNLIEKIWTEN